MSNRVNNLKIFIIYGILFEVMTNLYKPFSAKFMERIGGDEFYISLLNSLPGVAMFFSVLIGSFYLNKFADQKKTTGRLILFSRIFILLFASVPLVTRSVQPTYYILLIFFFHIPFGMYQVSYQSFIGQIFRPGDRAKALAKRNKYSIAAVMVVTLSTGLILSKLPSTEAQRLQLYQLFFLLSFIIGIVEYVIFRKFDSGDVPKVPKKTPVKAIIKLALKNKAFMIYLACSLTFHFGWAMGWPLFSIYMIKNLGADEAWLSVISIGSSIAMYFGHDFWAHKINEWGNHIVLWITTLGMALTPIIYAVSPNLYILAPLAAISGIFTSGTITVLMNGVLEVTPTENRPIYLGFYNGFINIALATAPLIGHQFLQAKGIVFALIATAVFRLIGSATFYVRDLKKA